MQVYASYFVLFVSCIIHSWPSEFTKIYWVINRIRLTALWKTGPWGISVLGMPPSFLWTIINNYYWARLSKIILLWFVSGEQIISIICRSRRLRQIIDLWDTDKSQYFAITEFNNYSFIIRSSFYFDQQSISNQSLPARETNPSFSHKSVVSITHEQNIICSKTLICRQLFAGHLVSSRPMKRKEKIHRMIINNYWMRFLWYPE